MIQLNSIPTCPKCGFQKEETMPEDSCRFFYDCEDNRVVLNPKPGYRVIVTDIDSFVSE